MTLERLAMDLDAARRDEATAARVLDDKRMEAARAVAQHDAAIARHVHYAAEVLRIETLMAGLRRASREATCPLD